MNDDPVMKERAERLKDLVGRTLEKVEVVPIGVLLHFSSRDGDNGAVFLTYGPPSYGERK